MAIKLTKYFKYEYVMMLPGLCRICVCVGQSRIPSQRVRFDRRRLQNRNLHKKLGEGVCCLSCFLGCRSDSTMVCRSGGSGDVVVGGSKIPSQEKKYQNKQKTICHPIYSGICLYFLVFLTGCNKALHIAKKVAKYQAKYKAKYKQNCSM